MQPEDKARERRKRRAEPDPPSPMPRSVKYAWGLAVSALLALSFFVDQASPLMPLLHRAIDALQTQTAPIESR